jgi:hypothetical protein
MTQLLSSAASSAAGFVSANPVAAIAGGVSLLGGLNSGNQQVDQSRQEAAVDNANAAQSVANMQAVEAQASAREVAQRSQSAQYLGRQRAAMADSGTGALDTGSNYDVGYQSAVSAEMDALNTRYAGQLQGAQALQQANNFKYGADAATSRADSFGSTNFITAGLQALQSGASVYGSTQRLKLPGTGTNTYSYPEDR